MLKSINNFPFADGHIESIVIGVSSIKISFQTWNCRKLVLIYHDVIEFYEKNAVGIDVGDYTIQNGENGNIQYLFFDSWDNGLIVSISAGNVEIYDVGSCDNINKALYDVGFDYLGG